jgi:Aerobic-type carbon monoxide dehydrogenase, middle subunit CoxM/CutM homologs
LLNGSPGSSGAPGDGLAPTFRRPATLDEALGLLADGGSTVIAGCTLYYLDGDSRPLTDRLIDITGLAALKDIAVTADHVRLGACVTWSQVADAALPAEVRPLQQAARRIGALQIQNVGTLGGNICGASANADGIPPLLIADATVELRAAGRSRTLPLADFLRGHRQTARAPDELLTAIIVPRVPHAQAGVFLKLSRRAYQGLASVSVAARLGRERDGRIASAAVAVGTCSAVAQRLPLLERRLESAPADAALPALFDPAADLACLTPATDMMATADYRREAVATLVRRALQTVQRSV